MALGGGCEWVEQGEGDTWPREDRPGNGSQQPAACPPPFILQQCLIIMWIEESTDSHFAAAEPVQIQIRTDCFHVSKYILTEVY